MPLAPGTRVGGYDVVAAVGAGGMGEVYRARDASLERDVAIKVLPELLTSDPDRVARFTREAKTLASLNHQNIAHIHGVVDSPFALVMEFVEGEDLAQRLKLGAIPLDEAIPIAKQIADALECAHEQGIIHRDLKPANVKVRPDGTVKVLDFGLAKALGAPEGGASSSAVVMSPTFTSPAMTQLGIILGTAAYMAPEQARGKSVDKRADVWAFGVVLFEMLSGIRAFEGSEVSDTLACVLLKDPDWTALPPNTPAPLRRLLRRCLHKDRKQRLADISDARLDLDEALGAPAAELAPVAPPPRASRWRLIAIPAALAAGILIGGPAALKFLAPPPPPAPVAQFAITLPEGQAFTNTGRHFLAISPDGSQVIYNAESLLNLRPIASRTAQPIPGSAMTTGVINPTFSPDGQSVAFFSEGGLYKLPVSGGVPFLLTSEFVNPFGMSWIPGWILAGQGQNGIVRVPEAGGKPEVILQVESGGLAFGPQLLPDGDTLIFTVYPPLGGARFDKGQIFAYSLRTKQRKLLHDGGSDGRILPTGHLAYGTNGVIYALDYDARTQTVSGTPRPILQGVRRGVPTGAMQYRVADNGTLIYVAGPVGESNAPRTLGWIDKAGKASPLGIAANTYDSPRMSPDGKRLAVGIATETDADIWIQDLPATTAMRRLTFGGRNQYPVWSPDGKQIAFQSDRDGTASVYVQDADLSGSSARLLIKAEPGVSVQVASWSINGWLAVGVTKGGQTQLHVASAKDPKLQLFTPASPNVQTLGGAFSPDGRWLAYFTASNLAPGHVYVEPFPATDAKYQIVDGLTPMWNPRTSELMAALRNGGVAIYKITTTPAFSFSQVGGIDRRQLPLINVNRSRAIDFTPDGTRLLSLLPSQITDMPQRDVNVVLNWFEELKKK